MFINGQPTSISLAKVITEIESEKNNIGIELEKLGVMSSKKS